MAISLKSVAEGTSDTVRGAFSNTARKAMSAVPNPAQAMENLGLGVGTLVRNIRETSKKEKRPATEVEQKKGNDQSAKKINQMTVQLTMANSLLKEIRNLQIKQLSAVKGQGGKGLAAKPSERRAFAANTSIRGASVTSLAAAPTAGSTDKADGKKDVPFKLIESIVGLGAIWTLLPKEMKAALGKLAGNVAGELQGVVVEGIGGIIKNAWNNNAIATTVAGLYVAHITGILGFAGNAVRASIATYNFAKNFAGAGSGAGETVAPGTTKGAPVTSTAPVLGQSDAQAAVKEYNARMNSPEGARPSLVANSIANKYNLTPEQMGQVQAGKTPTIPGAPGAALDKLKAFGKGAGVAGSLLTVGTGTMEYLMANRDEKLGRINREEASKRKGGAIGGTTGGLAGGLAGAAAGAKGGASVGAFFGPMGAAVGGLVGGIAGGFAGGYVGGSSGRFIGEGLGSLSSDKNQATAQTVVQNASVGGDGKQSLDIIEQVFKSKGFSDIHVRAAQIVAAAESGLIPGNVGDNGNSIGLFQLNRAGGEGAPYSVDELKDPHKNATIVADKMNTEQGTAFREAKTVEEAITALVRDFERPSFVRISGNKPYIADPNAFNQYVGRGAAQLGARLNASTLAQSASVAGSGITSASVSSPSAMKGAEFAGAQQTLDELMKALGSSGTVNIQNIVNQAVREGKGSAGRDGPKRTGPSGSDAAARNAIHAVGFD